MKGTFSTVYKAEDLLYEHYYNDWDINSPDAAVWVSPPIKEGTSSPAKHKGPRYVAIKKIYVTSSPIRIQNELELLNDLKWCKSICPLITAFRCQDQVVAVLPYYRHQDFRVRIKSIFIHPIDLRRHRNSFEKCYLKTYKSTSDLSFEPLLQYISTVYCTETSSPRTFASNSNSTKY